MIFEKIVSEGLAHNSYLLGSRGEAAVIDPRRDCDIYVTQAMEHDVTITHIFETHRNEDYIIGSLELAAITGADIYHGSHMDFAYGNPVNDEDTFKLGTMELLVLNTPGHTEESISIALIDKEMGDEIYMVFTGDALFAGDVGRTDFFGKAEIPRVAGALYDSIFNRLIPLGDGVIVCPAHGAGSVCGSHMVDHEFTTIGYEKKVNPMLQLSREEFIDHKMNEILYQPPYFKYMETCNKEGAPPLNGLPLSHPLNPQKVESHMEEGVQVLDVRNPSSFSGAHIPGSYNVWEEGVPLFAGWVLAYDSPIIIIDEDTGTVPDILMYLARIGYDSIAGHLAGGFSSWYKSGRPLNTVSTWSVHDLETALDTDIFLLDVRERSNWNEDGFIEGAHNIFVGEIADRLEEIPQNNHTVIYCDSGFKTSIAASILKKNGYEHITTVLGGMAAWKNAQYPVNFS
ncbi:MAG: rhodanese-like domain-containing protein [Candidatus Thorarchaeota archaeon]|jgi:hydroxyacylglutathione hydrolase